MTADALVPECTEDPEIIDIEAADLVDRLVALCRRVLGRSVAHNAWTVLDSAEVEVRPISGGITNMLFRVGPVETSSSLAEPVLVRVFGKAGDVVCDRRTENQVFASLSASGFGPKLHGLFANGRLEGWLRNRRPLEPLEMFQTAPIDFISLNARRVAEMHETCRPKCATDLWTQMDSWLEMAKTVSFPNDATKAKQLETLAPFPRFEQELNALKEVLPSPKNGHGAQLIEDCAGDGALLEARKLLYELRFCHMDLLSGNIMCTEGESFQPHMDVKFIDFEYSMWACVGIDIANHFNAAPESCLILDNTFDVDKYYPSESKRRRWLNAYFGARNVNVSEDVITAMLKVLHDFTLLAELRWVIWSIVQAAKSTVDFDYLDFGLLRFEKGYLKYRTLRDEAAKV